MKVIAPMGHFLIQIGNNGSVTSYFTGAEFLL